MLVLCLFGDPEAGVGLLEDFGEAHKNIHVLRDRVGLMIRQVYEKN